MDGKNDLQTKLRGKNCQSSEVGHNRILVNLNSTFNKDIFFIKTSKQTNKQTKEKKKKMSHLLKELRLI
jgi:hypothetical protein